MYAALYVLGCPDLAPVKIGASSNLPKRLTDMQSDWPYRLTLYHAWFAPARAAGLIRNAAHEALAKHRTRGEWFDINPLIAAVYVSRAAMSAGVSISTPSEVLASLDAAVVARPADADVAAMARKVMEYQMRGAPHIGA